MVGLALLGVTLMLFVFNNDTSIVAGFGFGEIKLDSAKDIISFLSTYNKNINRILILAKF